MYYVYMIRCSDNSIYTGITNDIKRRMKEHFSKDKKCAKYTRMHDAKKIEIVFETETKSLASKLEFNIKQLKKIQKEELILDGDISKYLSEKIDINKYTRYTFDLQ